MNDAPLLRATGLWAKTSAKTNRQYLTGRLGGLRVLIMENNRREGDNDPTHLLLFGEAQQQQGQQQRQQETPLAARHRMAREAEEMKARQDAGRQQQAEPDLDDEIPF